MSSQPTAGLSGKCPLCFSIQSRLKYRAVGSVSEGFKLQKLVMKLWVDSIAATETKITAKNIEEVLMAGTAIVTGMVVTLTTLYHLLCMPLTFLI